KDPTRSEAMLAEFVSGVVILGIDDEICRRFGQLRGSLRGAGKIVGDFDLLIAASALRHNLTLLTNNRPILKESRACTWRVRPRKVRLPPILAEARTHAAVREESQ
ncbi:MAG TPA: type II toxin-antitoxin system VapC family toxin, partial [Terriglobia bacterium]|nr:type II toxin-antitoxin system VapC family toxin [Terriglobia bacterium]